jgi:hypothetical protein
MLRTLALFLLLAFLAGCGGKGPVGPRVDPPVPSYSSRSEPVSTVLDYALAWERRDSVQIDSLLAVDYEGTSTDIGLISETLSFTKANEVRAVGGLRLDATVTTVSVQLGPPSSWTFDTNPADPSEWVTIGVPNPRIYVGSTSFSDVTVAHSTCSFKLKPIASGPDTTWVIVRWTEIHTNGP